MISWGTKVPDGGSGSQWLPGTARAARWRLPPRPLLSLRSQKTLFLFMTHEIRITNLLHQSDWSRHIVPKSRTYDTPVSIYTLKLEKAGRPWQHSGYTFRHFCTCQFTFKLISFPRQGVLCEQVRIIWFYTVFMRLSDAQNPSRQIRFHKKLLYCGTTAYES